MIAITAGEAALVAAARALVEPAALPSARHDVPATISSPCEALVADALGHVWPALWRRDRACVAASIANGRVVRGRIWERHAPESLRFTAATLRLLRWLGGGDGELADAPLAIGDQVAIYLALDATDGTPMHALLAREPMIAACPLAQLGFAHATSSPPAMPPPNMPPPDMASLVTGAGAIAVEVLARELAERWRRAEHAKARLADAAALAAIGRAQSAALAAFFAACDAAGRRDLAAFVLDAAEPLLARWPDPERLDPAAPLAARAAARQASGALLRGVARWAAWDREHRGVRFFDDGYAIAQLLLARFEPIGHAGAAACARALAERTSLSPARDSSIIEGA